MSSPVGSRFVRTLFIPFLCWLIVPAHCLAAGETTTTPAATTEDAFSRQYTETTKRILLSGVELERFSLNYRLEKRRPPLWQKLIFFGSQETGASCGLAFEVAGVQQFGRARHKLLAFNSSSVGNGLRAAETGSTIAASGSTISLVSNAVRYAKGRKHGFDTRAANQFVASRLQQIDQLLAQREALVAAHPQHPAHDRALIEGKILQAMRGTFVNEYAHFNADTRSASTVENLFYLSNASYNTVGAVAAGIAHAALNKPKLNGPANILFIISGAMAAGTPLICSAELWAQRKFLLHSLESRFKGSEAALAEVAKQRAQLEGASAAQGSLMPSFPSTQRLAVYTESNQLFVNQLQSETTTMRRLNKVAVQNVIMGPAIGGLLMTQGILGTAGFYDYFPRQPKKLLNREYQGAICGTVGTSMAVVGTAAWLLASLSYEHRLSKEKRLPEQLIQQRLTHLDELEKIVNAI
jgi:hypothetical protein